MNSCQKGKRGEREFRDILRAEGYEAKRGQQHAGGADSPDVVSSLPMHIEVKRCESLRLREAVSQARRDAGGKPWIVAHKWNGGEWLIVQAAPDWFRGIRGDFAEAVITKHTQRNDQND